MKCCNPGCNTPFDHREGRLIRVSKASPGAGATKNQDLIEHFWLCGKCSGQYVLEHEFGMPIKVRLRDTAPVRQRRSSISAA